MIAFLRQPAKRIGTAGLLVGLVVSGLIAGLGNRGAVAHEGHGMPARLQQGSCEEIGPVAFELHGVGAIEDAEGNEIPAPETMGASGNEVRASVTTVDATLDTIVSDGHAAIVYLSDDAMDQPVACGDVGGIVVGEDLVVGLAPIGDEGMSGIALFRADGESTVVSLFLTSGAHEHAEGDEHADEHAEGEHEATPSA